MVTCLHAKVRVICFSSVLTFNSFNGSVLDVVVPVNIPKIMPQMIRYAIAYHRIHDHVLYQ